MYSFERCCLWRATQMAALSRFLMAHGFPMEMLEGLVTAGFAKASLQEMRIARRQRKVVCFQITEVGRKAAGEN